MAWVAGSVAAATWATARAARRRCRRDITGGAGSTSISGFDVVRLRFRARRVRLRSRVRRLRLRSRARRPRLRSRVRRPRLRSRVRCRRLRSRARCRATSVASCDVGDSRVAADSPGTATFARALRSPRRCSARRCDFDFRFDVCDFDLRARRVRPRLRVTSARLRSSGSIVRDFDLRVRRVRLRSRLGSASMGATSTTGAAPRMMIGATGSASVSIWTVIGLTSGATSVSARAADDFGDEPLPAARLLRPTSARARRSRWQPRRSARRARVRRL